MSSPSELSSKASVVNDSSEKHRLPISLTPLIGREREITELRQILRRPDVRLVTITGSGGVGKTSLALQVAHELSATFAGGAHFISLAAIRDPTLIIPTIANVLGLVESPDRLLFDSLKDFLRDRHMLLLIDNFEQVISAAPLLTELLSAAGELKLLVTSREALRLRGEHEFPLAPLELSDRAQMPERASLETLLHFPAIALFVQRAQASQPDFHLTQDNAMAVVEICTRLDGLPLAIELAASRIKLLPPRAMLARLQESSLSLLTGGARDAPARQQTLRDTIQWSYDLLDAGEQRAFRSLSVFAGGCTLEAAVKVTSHQSAVVSDQAQETDHWSLITLDMIALLVNKSLLRQTETGGEPRLSMLETIREFGLEQLDQTNELEAVQRAHAEYHLWLAEETEPHLTGREQKAWLNRLGREQDNLRAALRWGFDLQEADYVLRLVGALWQYWHMRGEWSEGRRWLEEALALTSNTEVDKALLARALYAAATLIRHQYDLERARSLCEASVALYRKLSDRPGLLAALLQLYRILDFQGDYEPLQALLPEALALAEGLPDLPVKAQVYAELSMFHRGSIDSGSVARYLAESERIYRALDDPAGLAFSLLVQGQIATLQGDTARGQALFSEGERLAAGADDHTLKIRILFGRPVLAWLSGDDALARRQYEQLIVAIREMKDTIRLRLALASLALLPAVLHRQGLTVWAARVYGMADQLAGASKSPMLSGEYFDYLKKRAAAVRAEVRARLGDEAFARALAEGQSMTLENLLAIPHPPPDSTARAQPAPASVIFEPLTARELEVLLLLAQDLSNPQIAERLVVSRRTVEAHLRSIYAKFGVKSRDAAIHVAREHGMIEK